MLPGGLSRMACHRDANARHRQRIDTPEVRDAVQSYDSAIDRRRHVGSDDEAGGTADLQKARQHIYGLIVHEMAHGEPPHCGAFTLPPACSSTYS